MQYAKVITPQREALVALEPTNWGKPSQMLFDQTDASGDEVWRAYRHDNFGNPLQRADEARYAQRGWWAELFRDTVREGERGADGKGRLDVVYTSHAGTEWERTHTGIWAPVNGWYVPTGDGWFHEGTLIPFETVQDRNEAARRWGATGMPQEHVSYFWHPVRYDSERFVGRDVCPLGGDGGRFSVAAVGLPSDSGGDGVASRPAYKLEVVMEVTPAKAA